MKRVLQYLNMLSLIVAVFVNYYVNAKKVNVPSISEISSRYTTLLTPAGYAFSIWGLIYIALFVFVIYQLLDIFNKKIDNNFVKDIGWWFIVANIANAAWVIAFTHDQIGLSVVIMLIIFFSLLKVVLHTNMERWDAPVSIIGFLWWPVSLYFGWITIALVVNIAAWLVSSGWTGAPFSPTLWAILVLLIVGSIFIAMIWKRSMREYASVGVWGIAAIAVKNWDDAPFVAYIAMAVAIIIFINTGIHGYQNRATAPFARRVKQVEEH